MPDLMEGLAPYFNHFCYVVRDMEAAQSWFKRIMGVKHFGVTPIAMGPAMSARMRGKPCDFSIAYALGATGGATGANIELIVPERSDNIYQQFLDRHGPGLHHIGFFVPDFDRAVEPFRMRGLVPELEGDTGGSKFAYYDCEISPGYLVEIVHFADPEQEAAINQMTVAPE